METFKMLGLLLTAGVLGIMAMVIYKTAPRMMPAATQSTITNFEECAAAGNPIMESYPRQCRTTDGQHFVEEVRPPMPPETISANGCAVAGCSQQLCVSAEEAATIVSTCEFRSEYACYIEASCEPQADGKCGWTQTPQLEQCLAHPPAIEAETELQVI